MLDSSLARWSITTTPRMKFKKIIALFILLVNAVFQTTFANPEPADDPVAAVDKLFRELRTAPANRRSEIIESLYNFGKMQVPTPKNPASPVSPVLFTYGLDPRNRAVLAEVIPVLIDTLDGTTSNKAWWVLISFQGSCPQPKKEVWEQWWKTTGQKRFTAEK